MTSIATARDDILSLFYSAWNAGPPSQGIAVVYDDTMGSTPKDGQPALPWARAVVKHLNGGQASLANFNGTSRYRRAGIFTVQVFTPYGGGLSLSDTLVSVIVNAFEGKASTNGVWFRQVRINEVGQDGLWYQTNVLINFEYDEVK
jgi:hypothetical protein